jgi:hypothetical protein
LTNYVYTYIYNYIYIFVVYNMIFLVCSEIGLCYAAQAGLELVILLPPPPKCWDYKYAPPYPTT